MKVRTVFAFCPSCLSLAAGMAKGGRILERRSGGSSGLPARQKATGSLFDEGAANWR
jgi:hypothetical protein